jgi:hypothetical protein
LINGIIIETSQNSVYDHQIPFIFIPFVDEWFEKKEIEIFTFIPLYLPIYGGGGAST